MRRRRSGHDGGFTLIELVLVVAMMAGVGLIAFGGFTSGLGALARSDDDARGQADITIASERLSRDLRQGRGIAAGSSAAQLTIWIDSDADYAASPAELVTWRAVAAPASPGHFLLERAEGTAAGIPVGNTLVSDVTFGYDAADVTRTRIVTVTLEFDAVVDRYLDEKHVSFEIRLRNVE
jgi:prepilin-type N-terminal cleavage/methylation domain-containing protein